MMIEKNDIQTWGEAERVLLRASDFMYLLPQLALRGQISNYTITFPSKGLISDSYTVIPHGSATLVFSYDRRGIHGDLFGPATKSCIVGGLANECDMIFIIEFQPAGLYAFTGINQKELTDQKIPFALVNSAMNKVILEVMESSSGLKELIACLDKLLLERLQMAYPSALQIATKMTLEAMGNISGKKLSTAVCYSERQLNRIFTQYLGMNMKTFSRMVRINKAVRLLQAPQETITAVAYQTGFYDLSHFIHDFKSICGMAPQEYRNNMSDFYNEIAKF